MPPNGVRGDRERLEHILVHDYFKIDHDAVWRVVIEHIPVMIPALETALANWPPGGS